LRWVHLAAVAVIALQSWLGQLCPLTVWEQALRERAGEAAYHGSFIEHWLGRALYVEAPWWLFVLAYSLLLLLVALAWWRWPPRNLRRRH
jgi:polyferredoxin